MSVNIPRRDEEGSVDDMMTDEPDLGLIDDQTLKGDETARENNEDDQATITGQDGEEEVEEQPAAASPMPAPTPIAPSAIANRYRELVEAEQGDATTSEDGSTDGVLRSAASPLESFPTLSGDSPSIQVSHFYPSVEGLLLMAQLYRALSFRLLAAVIFYRLWHYVRG